MMRSHLISSVAVSLVLSSILWVKISHPEPVPGQSVIDPVEDDEILGILARAEKAKLKGKILREMHAYTKERRVRALAYALKEGKHRNAALQVIIDQEDLKDPGLTPFLIEAIRSEKDATLLLAAMVVNHIPGPELVNVLLNEALNSDYVDMKFIATEEGPEYVFDSVFAEAAEALYSITDGRIGSEKVRRDIMMPEEERNALIKKWRRKWREGWSACSIDFEEPLRNPPGISVDPKPFIGEWELIREGADKVEAGKSRLSVSQVEDGTLTVICKGEDAERKAHALLLTSVGQRKIVCVQFSPDRWRLYQLDLQDEGTRLVVKGLDWAGVKEDVLSGILPGKVVDSESEGLCQGIRITASGEEVRSYVEQRRNVFRVEHVYARRSP
jgi:hypothetical protein